MNRGNRRARGRLGLFWIGIAMIGYDMLGHMTCLLARLTGRSGAELWNTYSTYIWPSLANSVAYDAYWGGFFAIAITLLMLGREAP
jgi:hypothetical protein